MSTHKRDLPQLKHVPRQYTQARSVLGRGTDDDKDEKTEASSSSASAADAFDGQSTFVYVGGEVVPANAVGVNTPDDVRPIVNSQGITDEQVRRHYRLVERMQFRGPFWEGKRR